MKKTMRCNRSCRPSPPIAARHGRCKIFGDKGLGSRSEPVIGSAEEIADELQSWVEDTDIDGFNLSRVVTSERLDDYLDLVVPLLHERSVYKRDYDDGTLREKLLGPGRARLAPGHPGATCREQTAHTSGNWPHVTSFLSCISRDGARDAGRHTSAEAASANCSEAARLTQRPARDRGSVSCG